MKWVTFLYLMLFITVTAGAQQVLITMEEGDHPGSVVIGYACEGIPADERPVGFALKVVAFDGNITGLIDFNRDDFPVYLDYAYSEEVEGDGFTDDPWEGHPLAASESLPGALSVADDGSIIPTDMVVICMARLDNPGEAPPEAASLVTLHVDVGTYVTIELEEYYRGGVVSSKPGVLLDVVLPEDLIPPPPPCQYPGDLDCDGFVTTFDLDILLADLVSTAPNYYRKAIGFDDVKYDIDLDGWVTSFDLNELLANLVATAPEYYYKAE